MGLQLDWDSDCLLIGIQLGLGFCLGFGLRFYWDLFGIEILIGIAIGIGIAIEIRGCLRDTLLMGVEKNHVSIISEVESRSFQSKYSKCSCHVAFNEKLYSLNT